ncbi:MAG: hypothetical protein KA247_06160 [Bacteroidetes bacterium]|nr:hypothetical protein [Bacteroidota bacterium]
MSSRTSIPISRIAAALIFLLLASCSKEPLGITDAGNGTGKGPASGIIIKRSSQEDFYAMRYSASKNKLSNTSINGGGVISVSYQDMFFEDVSGYPGDADRPIIERNLLLAEISMSYQIANKGGIQSFGNSAAVSFGNIALRTSRNAADAGVLKRNFAFVRNPNGSISGAAGYEGASEPFDTSMGIFLRASTDFTVSNSDTVESISSAIQVDAGILFDSGKVYSSTNDMTVRLNRNVAKGSIITFSKLRRAQSSFPYIPATVSYELLADTNEIRIPRAEVSQVIALLTATTGVPKPFSSVFPFWLNIIESGPCDTLQLTHSFSGKEFTFTVYQYHEFGRKLYFK